MSRGRLPHHHGGGSYRKIDLSKPWESTPRSDHFLPLSPLVPAFKQIRPWDTKNSPSPTISVVEAPLFDSEKTLWARILNFLKTGTFTLKKEIIIPAYDPSEPDPYLSWKVELIEWKQYGYWAAPRVHEEVAVHNTPASTVHSVSTDFLAGLIPTLQSPGRTHHPERWVQGMKHRSLAPRPERWSIPIPGEPLPFPWEVQINPLLYHLLWGPSPLKWSLDQNPRQNSGYGSVQYSGKMAPADMMQPATWPFLTHMYFNAMASDEAPTFPWPFTVENLRGIKVGDVLDGIYEAFQVPILDDEKMSWPRVRQLAADRAHKDRCGLAPTDVMRRCDSFGAMNRFRGIEPTIDGGGWMITFGSY